jgi:hypothetical protein
MQTKEEILAIGNSWKRPAGLVDNYANGSAIANGIDQLFGGVWSVANLDAVVARISDQLQFTQTQEQVDEIFREWRRAYAPKDLKMIPENVVILNAYVKKYFGGQYSISALTAAATHADGLQHVSPAELQAAREQKEHERMERDRIEMLKGGSQKERNFAKEVQEHNAAEKRKKEQASAKAQIDSLISGYIANRANGPGQDYSLTDKRQKEMRAIEAKHLDATAALKEIREKLFSYPG